MRPSLATPPFRKIVWVMFGRYLETCLSNLKSIPLTVLEQLAFNAKKFRGSRVLGHSPFRKNLRDRVRTVP